jgi:hypothetical protein
MSRQLWDPRKQILRAATFQWCETNGATPSQVDTNDRTEANFKNIDDSTTNYASSPIAAGNNSYSKWIFGRFSGTFNTISAGLFAHTANTPTGALPAGLTLKGQPAMTGDPDRLTYTTPATAALTSLTFDQTAITAIASGRAVFFGPASANASGKAASMTTNPCFTNYLTAQLQTTVSASAGDTPTITFSLRYDEN